MGPRVATLVAATMRGRTSHCLRGFGYRPAPIAGLNQHPDGQSCEDRGDSNKHAPTLEKSAEKEQRGPLNSSPKRDARDVTGAPSLPVGAMKRTSCATGRAPGVPVTSMRQSLSGLQRTSALASPTSSSRPSLSIVSGAVGGTAGSANQITAVAAAFEEDLGRPQTAGTASG